MGARFPFVVKCRFGRAFELGPRARPLLSMALSVLALGLPGCAAGVIGAIIGGASGGGGGGSDTVIPPPSPGVLSFPGVVTVPPLEPEPSCFGQPTVLPCDALTPEEQAELEGRIAAAFGLGNRAREKVTLKLAGPATLGFRLKNDAGEVEPAGFIVDGKRQGEPVKLGPGTRTVDIDVSNLGTQRPEILTLEILNQNGDAGPPSDRFTVDNRPPAGLAICGLEPGSSCSSRPDLDAASVCSFVAPAGASPGKVQVALFRPDATGSCQSLFGDPPVEVSIDQIEPGTSDCAANLEARFVVPPSLSCQSTDVVLVVAETSGLDSESGPGPAVIVSRFQDRIDSSVPDLSDLRIGSFQTGSSDELFGIVVIDYTVKDDGGEPVDVDITAVIGSTTLRASAGTLTPYLGAPCEGVLGKPSEGIECLATSPAGVPHRFVWNLDFDIDRLLRANTFNIPRRTGVRLQVDLKDQRTGRIYESLSQVWNIDNSILHTVAGLQPGRTALGANSVPREQITFETVSGIDVDESSPGDPIFRIVDSGTHTLWSWRPGAPGDVTRVAGTGALRIGPADDFNGELPSNLVLRQPIDVVTDSGGVIFLLERSGRALWRITENNVELVLDERVLRNPEQMALDKQKQILYIADTGNCRILRCDLTRLTDPDRPEDGVTVIAGDLRILEPGPLYQRLFADAPAVFDERSIDGCNFRDLLRQLELNPDGVPAPGEGDIDAPEGIAFHSSPGGEFLFISDTANVRIARVTLGGPDPGTTVQTLVSELPGDRELCTPASLALTRENGSPSLFVSLRGFIEEDNARGTKGIVVRAPIVETGPDAPSLGGLETFAGIDQFSKGDCGPQNQASTYNPLDECLPATEAPLALPEEIAELDGVHYLCDSRNQQVRRIGAVCPNGGDRIAKLFGSSVEGRSPCEATALPIALCQAGPPAEAPLSSRLDEPLGLLLFGDERILLTDRGNGRLRLLDLRTGSVVTLAGRERTPAEEQGGITFQGDGGPALQALFKSPRSPAVVPRRDWCGNPDAKIYIADTGNHVVRVIDANGDIDTAVGLFALPPGTGPRGEQENRDLGSSGLPGRSVILKFPKHLLVDSRNRIFISDSGRHRILLLENGLVKRVVGVGSTFVDRENENEDPVPNPDPLIDGPGTAEDPGVGDGSPALSARLNTPNEMAFDEDEEHLYFADGNNHRVRRVRYDVGSGVLVGNVETVAGTGSNLPVGPTIPGTARRLAISFPYGLAFSRDFQFLFCTETFGFSRIYRVQLQNDLTQSRVCRLAGAVTFGAAGDGEDAVNAQFLNPNSLQVDTAGNLYVLDGRNHRLRKFFPIECRQDNP